jgi:hypothetical protein
MLKEFVVSEVNSLGHKNCGGMSHLGMESDQLQIQMMLTQNWFGMYAGPGALLQILYWK